MSPDQPQQQVRQLSPAALQALYQDLGSKTHTIYELQAQLAESDAELTKAKALLADLHERYGPKDDETGAAPDDQEPASLPARRQKASP